jgi:HD-like signal output (HDOD) protein
MNQALYLVDDRTLRSFQPLKGLPRDELELLASQLQVDSAQAGEQLIELGSTDNYQYFLITGRVRLEAADGKTMEIEGGTARASSPIAQLVPRRFNVTALTPVQYLRIAQKFIPSHTPQEQSVTTGIIVHNGIPEEQKINLENRLTKRLYSDLKQDKLILPSLPEVAMRVGRAVKDQNSNANSVARVIQTDPAITAKIVKAANSAFYGGMKPVTSCNEAIVRLGMQVTHNLVLAYTLRDLFQTKSKMLQQRMQELWRHSNKVAAICYVLARNYRRFNADEAMLIGLLHDIGVAAIVNQTTFYPDLAMDKKSMDHAIANLRGPVGSSILEVWNFRNEFVIAAREAEDWMRNDRDKPDYCDLVLVAQLHGLVGTEQAINLPPLNEVPALKRLGLEELTPKQSLKILAAAETLIEDTENLFTA